MERWYSNTKEGAGTAKSMMIIIPKYFEKRFRELMSENDWDLFEINPTSSTNPVNKITFPRQPISKELRWAIWKRDNFTCRNCGSRKYLHIDHIKPVSKGGKTIKSNLQTLCSKCNIKKGSKYEVV